MTRSNLSERTLARTHLALLLFALLTTLTIAGQTWWAIAQDKQQTLASETNNGFVAVRLLEEHASQTLQDAVHTLDRVARAVRVGDPNESPTLIRSIVASHDIGHSRHLKALQYVSPQGTSWVSSPDYPTHQTEASQSSHIQYLLTHPADDTAVVGHPYASPYDSQWVIPVARNLYDPRGRAMGVINVDIRLSYFGTLYSRVAKENKASVTLLSNQGFILARSPFEARYVDRDVTDSLLLESLRSGPVEGSFEDTAFLDDDEGLKLYAYRRLASFPITMVYTRDHAQVLTAWESRTYERLLLAAFSIALVAALTYTLRVYIQRLQRAQCSLRESEAKFFGLFRQSPVPHTLVRRLDGQFIEANDAWLTQYGYRLHEVIGTTATKLKIWVDPSQREQLVLALAPTGKVDRFEAEHRHSDGSHVTVQTSGRILRIGDEDLILFTLVDVTRQREAELEIRNMNVELEQRVQARTKKLEIANAELSLALASVQTMQTELLRSEKLAALGSLVAGVAHELNTPIGNSVTVGSTLQHQVAELAQTFGKGELRRSTLQTFIENAQRGTDILMHALTRASELIRSFKRVAVDQASDQRRRFDLQLTLREVCLTLEPMYKKTPFDLTLALPDKVEMDSYPGALGQLITNFVTNALQHGFEGRERGQMHLRAVAEGPDTVTLLFSDDGAGMTQSTRNRVFDPFFTTKLGQGGSGLGMSIVYNIVHDVLGGTIEVASSPDAGTLITVHIPICAPRPVSTTDE